MSGEYYCGFCSVPVWDSLHMCGEKYDFEMAKYRIGVDEDPPPRWKDIDLRVNLVVGSLIKELKWQK